MLFFEYSHPLVANNSKPADKLDLSLSLFVSFSKLLHLLYQLHKYYWCTELSQINYKEE